MNEVWKVCRVEDDGTFWSAFAVRCGPALDLQYQLGEETRATEGTVGILCFPARADAEAFVRSMTGWLPAALLRCTTDYATEPTGVLFDLCTRVDLWLYGEVGLRYAVTHLRPFTMPAPVGTVTVPSLTPVECVWERVNE